jgi:hypothetical protein
MFQEYGSIESASIIKNHHTQKSKGCGFVKFEDPDAAKAAVEVRIDLAEHWSYSHFFRFIGS